MGLDRGSAGTPENLDHGGSRRTLDDQRALQVTGRFGEGLKHRIELTFDARFIGPGEEGELVALLLEQQLVTDWIEVDLLDGLAPVEKRILLDSLCPGRSYWPRP